MEWDRYPQWWHLLGLLFAAEPLVVLSPSQAKTKKRILIVDLLHQTAVGVTFSYANTLCIIQKFGPAQMSKCKKIICCYGKELFIPGLLRRCYIQVLATTCKLPIIARFRISGKNTRFNSKSIYWVNNPSAVCLSVDPQTERSPRSTSIEVFKSLMLPSIKRKPVGLH